MEKAIKFDELIDFAEKQFTTDSFKCDFRKLQPKVYLHPDKYLNKHRLFYKDDKLAGLYLVYKTAYRGLSLEGIGTVCVNNEYRNLGIMKEMMLDSLDKTRADILYLAGDKKRYERYGFYICGKKIVFSIKLNNRLKDIELKEYRKNDEEINKLLYSMYSSYPGSLLRDYQDYNDLLRTGGNIPYLIMSDDAIKGYLCYSKDKNRIVELVAPKNIIAEVINSLIKLINKKDTYVELSIDSPLKIILMRLSERYSIESITNIRLINPCRVIKTLLATKPDLMDGELVLPKINTNKNIKIEVKNSKCSVYETDELPTLALGMDEVYLLLFSNYLDYYDAKFNFISSWFPLDLPQSISAVDSI